MATTNNPLTAAAKAIAAAQAKVASAQKVQRTATNSYKASVNALSTAQKAVKTLTSLKGGLTLKNAQTALAAAQRVVGAAQTIVKSTQMAVNTATTTVKKLTGQGGSAGNPAIDNAIRQRVPYNAQTNTGTGPTMSSGRGLLNIPGATQIAQNQADPEGNVNASRPEEFSSAADRLGVSSTENIPVTTAVADASGGHTVPGALGTTEVRSVPSTIPSPPEPPPPAVASRSLTGPPITTQAERDAFVTHERAGVVYTGGTTQYVTAGAPKANAASDAVQPAINAKQAEIDQFNRDNPSSTTLRMEGKPMLTPEQDRERQRKVRELHTERRALVDKQNELKTPETTPPVVVSNTATNTSTTVDSKAAVRAEVDTGDGAALGLVDNSGPIATGPGTSRQVTQETTTVSGGGTTYVTAGVPKANAASDAVQPAIDVKQAEIDQFNKDNPSNFARKKQGLPPLSAEESQQRQEKLLALNKEKSSLIDKQQDLKTPESTPPVVVPNTTTTVSTTVTSKAAAREPVDPEDDESLGRQAETSRGGNPFGNDIETIDLTAAEAGSGNQRIDREEDGPGNANTPVAPAAAAAGSDDRDTTTNELGGVVPDPTPVISPAPVGVVDTNAGELGNQQPTTIDQDRIQGLRSKTALQPTLQARNKQPASADWRVRLQLAPGATYLYQATDPGILAPLAATDGVIFPYTPTIETAYVANYDTYDLTHSNFRGYFYKGSKVNDINIRAIFTAQDTKEAGYMLAVIHFFRSVTKMFYGANDPLRGAPPPLTYLTGLGQYQFNQHPCVVQSFNYTLPSEVDYIRAEAPNNNGTNLGIRRVASGRSLAPSSTRLGGTESKPPVGAQFKPGETSAASAAALSLNVNNLLQATYVPTKIEISLVLLPINTRSQVSQQFNMQGFANGQLLKAGFW